MKLLTKVAQILLSSLLYDLLVLPSPDLLINGKIVAVIVKDADIVDFIIIDGAELVLL